MSLDPKAVIDLDEKSFASLSGEVTLDAVEVPAGEKAVLSVQLPEQFIIVFEPVTHSAYFIHVEGEPTEEPQQLGLIFNKVHPPTRSTTLFTSTWSRILSTSTRSTPT